MKLRPLHMTGFTLLLIIVIGLAGVVSPAMAKSPASKIKQLRAKKAATIEQRREVESKLRAVKKVQRSASAQFHASEARLSQAERELRHARVRLQVTEQRIREAQNELSRIEKRLEVQTAELWQRLEMFYKRGQVGYVEVLLGATDFEQFVDRAVYYRNITEHDLALKSSIEDNRTRQVALQKELERNWIELNSLKAQCGAKAQQIKVETSRRHAVLAEVKQDRAAHEAAYGEILETQKEIERVLWRLNQAPSGSGGPVRQLSGGFILPCNGRFSSSFGWRTHPILHTRRFHDGQDIAAPSGTTIRAAAAGTVVRASRMGAYGLTVMISHGSGYTTLYGHCSSILVSDGQSVSQGQPIARVGSTGWSTGPHCHFSVYRNGTAINPLSVRR